MFSCWYSFNEDGIGVGRSHVVGDWTVKHPLNIVEYDSNTFDITSVKQTPFWGEDPRMFKHNGHTYIVNNFIHQTTLINLDTLEATSVNLPFKNFTWISHDDKLYAIFSMVPLNVFEVDVGTGACKEFVCEGFSPNDYIMYRGGTPGYHLMNGTYHGFGHMTYCQAIPGHPPTYEPFYWTFDFDTKKLKIDILQNKVPSGSRLIQPTCIVDGRYLVTAESMDLWGGPETRENWEGNGYATRVYKILW